MADFVYALICVVMRCNPLVDEITMNSFVRGNYEFGSLVEFESESKKEGEAPSFFDLHQVFLILLGIYRAHGKKHSD